MTASLRWNWILVGAFVLGLTWACGGDSQEAPPTSAAPAEATTPPAAPPAAPPQVLSGRLPADFPADVPRYPGARVTQARTSGDQGMSVSLTTDDDVEKVASFFADSFAAEGWSTDIRDTPGGRAIFADKAQRSASAVIHAEGDTTRVDLIVVQMN